MWSLEFFGGTNSGSKISAEIASVNPEEWCSAGKFCSGFKKRRVLTMLWKNLAVR
jgi:hypothetical protein